MTRATDFAGSALVKEVLGRGQELRPSSAVRTSSNYASYVHAPESLRLGGDWLLVDESCATRISVEDFAFARIVDL